MKKTIQIAGISIFCLVYFQNINIIAQNNIEPLVIKKSVVVKKTIEEDIQFLHQKLPNLIKKLNLENKPEIIISMGGKHLPGNKASFVYVQKVSVRIAGDSLSEIILIYDQANDTGSFRETREFVNKNPSELTCKDLDVRYKNSKGEKEEFLLNSIENEEHKVKVLRMYLENLNELVRWLEFYAKKSVIDQEKTIHKVLRVGSF